MHRQKRSGVVNDNIKTTKLSNGLINSRLHLFEIGDIAGYRQRFWPNFLS